MNITQHQLDRADLVLIVGRDGLIEISWGDRTRDQVAQMLVDVAKGVKAGRI
jgi:hypothetical protein